jgi:hypothetical protein
VLSNTDGAVNVRRVMGIFGAFIEGFDSGSVESDDRIYGMSLTDPDGQQSGWHAAAVNTPFMHYSQANSSRFGIFRPTSTTTWERLNKMNLTVDLTAAADSSVTLGGSMVAIPQYAHRDEASPYYMAGRIRQMRYIQEQSNRTIIQDSGANDKMFCWSVQDSPSVDDALAFCNG